MVTSEWIDIQFVSSGILKFLKTLMQQFLYNYT